ncbi:MAG TPA: PssE/Cps14G family polysaccharide biosynthesis glycosyltransferase [Flavobacteriaceae bacterium]|nr:PssE/Cps14G family polysaccharide biosynthesis glycosyltransferase [Flavobacteriaceae bacterium]
MGRIVKFVSKGKIFRINILNMVFITLGTQNFNFSRLLKAVESAINNGVLKEPVVAQIGNNAFSSNVMQCFSFLDKESFNKYIEEAEFVISHAGTGSIITALKKEKKVVVAPRLKKYKEHIDDHQLEILETFAKLNLIIPLKENLSDLEEKIIHINQYNLDKYVSNTSNFNKQLINLINTI